jgi:hypothetical protein
MTERPGYQLISGGYTSSAPTNDGLPSLAVAGGPCGGEQPAPLCGMAEKPHKRLERFLMSGIEAQKPENVLKMFEAIKGRKATCTEILELERNGPVAGGRSRRRRPR